MEFMDVGYKMYQLQDFYLDQDQTGRALMMKKSHQYLLEFNYSQWSRYETSVNTYPIKFNSEVYIIQGVTQSDWYSSGWEWNNILLDKCTFSAKQFNNNYVGSSVIPHGALTVLGQ